MRFDKAVFFQTIKEGEFDPVSGNYEESTVAEEKRFASVTAADATSLRLEFGSLVQGSHVVRVQGKGPDREYIRIGSTRYHVTFRRSFRLVDCYVVSEVQ